MKNSKQQNFLNIISNLLSLVMQFAINLIVVPKIIKDLGSEAIGYVNVSIDVVGYFSVIKIVFNSVASRFIAIEIVNNNYKKANDYLNSVLVANTVICIIMIFAGFLIIPNIDSLINITPIYVNEVKITFVLTWCTSIINVMSAVLSIGTYVTNRLNVDAVRNILSNLFKLVCIIILFSFLPLKVYFMPIATLASTIFLAAANLKLTKKYLPDLKFNFRLATKKSIKEIAASGIWMSFTSLSSILMRGMDNLIANLMFDQVAMGNLSIARTIPNAITTVINTLSGIFTPTFVDYYSRGDKQGLIKKAKNTISINGYIMLVPVSGFIAFSKPFYNLWLNGEGKEAIDIIIIMSIITVIQAYLNSTTCALSSLFIVTNKLKATVLVDFITGLINVILAVILASITNIGVIALTIANTLMMSVRYLLFRPWYTAKIIGAKASSFYLIILRTLLPAPILIAVFTFVSKQIVFDSWFKLIIVCGICGIIGYAFSAIIVFPKNEFKNLFKAVKTKFIK